ncbi:MAG: PulJ/GspJ family protein [Candidatus Rifleibacteriota bacterium]
MKFHRKGLTFIELTIVAVLGTLIIGMTYKIYSNIFNSSDKISGDSQYYLELGKFSAQIKSDLRSAVKVIKANDKLTIFTATEAYDKDEKIVYKVKEESNQIVRKSKDRSRIFNFGDPPEGAGKLVLNIGNEVKK